ncbi:MAG: M24 family metallopeptidase [Acidimicrobiia bacterium]
MNPERIAAARRQMGERGVDTLVVTVGSDLPYLIGYRAMENERITALVLAGTADPVLVVPALEAPRVESPVETRAWEETEDPIAIIAELVGEGASTIAIGNQTWATFVLALQDRLASARFIEAEPLMAQLRIVKDEEELAALRAAGAATDTVVAQIAEMQISGRTERQVARIIEQLTLESGHEASAFAIVASGPNGASPHHEATDRVIEPGDAVVVDFGGWLRGYGSDTSRMFVVGDPPRGFRDAFAVLREAQRAGIDAVRPGATAQSVDRAARDVIAGAGYGEMFIHRTGHGIGLDTHEHPYLVAGNTVELKQGMAFSIEPGIYRTGEWGMRIEDIVAVTEDGVERMNQSDRDLYVVD